MADIDPNFARYQQAGWIKPDDALDARQWRSLKHALGLDAVATWAGVVTEINRLKREASELRGELVELRNEFEWTRNQGISLRVEVERLWALVSDANGATTWKENPSGAQPQSQGG